MLIAFGRAQGTDGTGFRAFSLRPSVICRLRGALRKILDEATALVFEHTFDDVEAVVQRRDGMHLHR